MSNNAIEERLAHLEDEVRTLRARQDAMAGVAIAETYRIVQEVHTTQARHTEVLDQHSALLARQGEILGKILDRLDSIDARLADK
jgi:hypothetical protein